MKKYKVVIKEYSRCLVEVEADNIQEALSKAESDYWKDPNAYLLEPYDTYFDIQ